MQPHTNGVEIIELLWTERDEAGEYQIDYSDAAPQQGRSARTIGRPHHKHVGEAFDYLIPHVRSLLHFQKFFRAIQEPM
jgi:hypothetical protein